MVPLEGFKILVFLFNLIAAKILIDLFLIELEVSAYLSDLFSFQSAWNQMLNLYQLCVHELFLLLSKIFFFIHILSFIFMFLIRVIISSSCNGIWLRLNGLLLIVAGIVMLSIVSIAALFLITAISAVSLMIV